MLIARALFSVSLLFLTCIQLIVLSSLVINLFIRIDIETPRKYIVPFQYLKMKCLFDPCVKELAHSFTLYLFLNFFVGISLIYHAVIVSTGQ